MADLVLLKNAKRAEGVFGAQLKWRLTFPECTLKYFFGLEQLLALVVPVDGLEERCEVLACVDLHHVQHHLHLLVAAPPDDLVLGVHDFCSSQVNVTYRQNNSGLQNNTR